MNQVEALPLRRIQLFGWLLLVILIIGAVLLFSLEIAVSVLVGGVLANVSFWLLKRDLTALLGGELIGVKARFFIKYYARLALLAVILFLLVKYGSLNILGLLTGLSVVFLSIGGLAVSGTLGLFKIREAS